MCVYVCNFFIFYLFLGIRGREHTIEGFIFFAFYGVESIENDFLLAEHEFHYTVYIKGGCYYFPIHYYILYAIICFLHLSILSVH